MKLIAYVRSLGDALFHRSRTQGEIGEELASHIQHRVDDLERSGLPRAEAERRARIEFGGYERFREECGQAMGGQLLETMVQDVLVGLRMLRKSPGFTAVAVLTLALGIGGNTAIFSIVNDVLLNPLHFPQPDGLVALHESKPNFEKGSISYPNFLDWQKDNRVFSAMALARRYAFSLTGRGDAERVGGEFVSRDFFPLLGVNPLLGRTFTAAEEQAGAGPVVLISERLWRQKFDAARERAGSGSHTGREGLHDRRRDPGELPFAPAVLPRTGCIRSHSSVEQSAVDEARGGFGHSWHCTTQARRHP